MGSIKITRTKTTTKRRKSKSKGVRCASCGRSI